MGGGLGVAMRSQSRARDVGRLLYKSGSMHEQPMCRYGSTKVTACVSVK